MQYLLLIHHDEQRWEKLTQSEKEQIYVGFRKLRDDLEKGKKMLGGGQLQPTATATTVRVRDGKTSLTDGPFAETKEQLGGFFLVDATNKEDAEAIAARIPVAETGTIEVRPVMPSQQP